MIKSYSSSSQSQAFLETVLDELDASDPEQALHLLRRMKQHLSKYSEERRRLKKLGLNDLDDVLRVMKQMKNYVDKLRNRVEAYQQAQEKLHAIQDALNVDATPEETVATIANISDQLESLYEEKEILSRAGLSDADEAVRMIQSMREQLDEMYDHNGPAADESRETTPSGHSRDLLQRELGVSDPESVVEMVHNMERQLAEHSSSVEAAPSPQDSSSGSDTTIRTLERQMRAAQGEDVPQPTRERTPLLTADVLASLNDRSQDALNSLPVGALALDSEGRIQKANAQSPSLPGLGENPEGDAFFEQVPSAQNPLLQDPLLGRDREAPLNIHFVYTFSRPEGSPHPFHLHLYRESEPPTWLLYDAL